MRQCFLALTSLFALALPAADKPAKVFPLAYDQHDLSNGLRVITIPTDYPNIVALYIVVQAGSRNEVEPGKSGFAHLFEHMMFRGTKAYPPERYEAIMKEAGAARNAYTSNDRTVYHVTFSKEDLETMLTVEADRFQNLEYTEAAFKTEAGAVYGEYNKNSASPVSKLVETARDKAFVKHPYKHTTMGLLADIRNMPNLYEYSRQFFDRYYRPEYTTLIVAGDVDPKSVRALVAKHWGGWKRGSFRPDIPVEPRQEEPRRAHVDWPSPTLPYLYIAFKAPAYSDTEKDSAALDLLAAIGFSQNSDLYQKLIIQDQIMDSLSASNPDSVDPYLFSVGGRLKNAKDLKTVEEQVLNTLNSFKDNLVAIEKLDAVRRNMRYEFAVELDNSESIADTVASFAGLRRTPETINRRYALYDQLTPEDLRDAARKYFVENGRTIVTLTGPAQ